MFRDILASRAILAGLVFFMLIVSGSLFYSWHVRRATEAEFAQTDAFPQSFENKKDVGVSQDFESIDTHTLGSSEAPIASDDPQSMSEGQEALPLYNTDAVEMMVPLLEDIVSAEEEHPELPASPFGFGPYPEIPPDYPSTVVWKATNHGNLSAGTLQGIELLDRVLVKLWSEGERGFKGGIMAGSRVYPHYHNTAYVRYAEEAGYRYISEYQGGPDLPPLTREQLRTGKLPAGIRIIDMDSAGIDAYRFLNLK